MNLDKLQISCRSWDGKRYVLVGRSAQGVFVESVAARDDVAAGKINSNPHPLPCVLEQEKEKGEKVKLNTENHAACPTTNTWHYSAQFTIPCTRQFTY